MSEDELEDVPVVPNESLTWIKTCDCMVSAGMARMTVEHGLEVICPECDEPWELEIQA